MPNLTWLVSAGALLASSQVFGQNAEAVSRARMRSDLEYLASDALEGRMTLQKGSEVAIHWIAAEFEEAGLQPLGGRTFLQEVPLVEFRVDRERSTLAVRRGGREQIYRHGGDGFTSGFPDEVNLRAGVVFAGFGVTAPEFGYDDYKGIDARGKVVLIFDHEPQETDPKSLFNGVGSTRHASARSKVMNAQKHGAVAVLLASEPNRSHPTNSERIARVPGAQARVLRLPLQVLANSDPRIPILPVSDALMADLLAESGRKALDLQLAIDRTFKPQSMVLPGAEVQIRLATSERRLGSTYNVIGMLEGSDPELKAETIVYSGHFDHDGAPEGGIAHGADDNASGTAGVIELARAFAKAARPKRTLLFAVFAAEERGLLGSYYYTMHPLRPLRGTRAVINFDMIGRNETPSRQTDGMIEIAKDTSNELNLVGTINSPDYRETVESANGGVGLKLNYKWDRDAALNIYSRSDQYPFSLHEIPAIWWFTGFHPDYHQTTDTAEKINFEKMERIVRLAYLTGEKFANATAPPRFVERVR
ncbi:MAG: M28 family peptidase [Bryobacteraceae bacterium]